MGTIMGQTEQELRENFLSKTRVGYLSVLASDGAPRTVPVWFDWDGHAVRIFTSKTSPKVKRLRQDPRATFVVGNHVGEDEAWVAFDGTVTIQDDEAIGEFIEKLASRYWDLSDPSKKTVLDAWQADPEQFCLLVLIPTQIRSYFS